MRWWKACAPRTEQSSRSSRATGRRFRAVQLAYAGGCAFSPAYLAIYPPSHLLEPLSADFCPDACYAVRDSFKRVVLSVEHCELSNGTLTLANGDCSDALRLVASKYDLSGIRN